MKVKMGRVTDVTSSFVDTLSDKEPMRFKVTSPFRVRVVKATKLPEAIDAAMDDLLFAQAIDPISFKEAKIKLEVME